MSLAFVHLSDIHFGQEKGGQLFINNQVKRRLLDDLRQECLKLPDKRAAGIIVTGDVAFGGTEAEYKTAAAWLDDVTEAAGCKITDIQVIPGNHDIDWNEISAGSGMMLNAIRDRGEAALDEFLSSEADTALLYRRFRWYQPFAEAYRCPLDVNGGLAEERLAEIAKGRWLRFVRVNSALICSKGDQEGKLILGARQRVLSKRPGEEIVVLCHHPLGWFQDGVDAKKWVKSSARVFISGHEHNPSVSIEHVGDGCDLMMLAAGATTPPTVDDKFTYTYNILEFAWEAASDGLAVSVHPRAWSDDRKVFESDPVRLGGADPTFVLGCPNFKDSPLHDAAIAAAETSELGEAEVVVIADRSKYEPSGGDMAEDYPLLLLHFFRDITPVQRLKIFIELGALPAHISTTSLTQPIERRAFDMLVRAGKSTEISNMLQEILKSESRGN